MKNEILFYSTRGEYGALSNFSRHGFTLDDVYWKTSEHYFQAKKFEGTEHEQIVREASSPKEAARLGRQRSRPLRDDWEDVKEDVMFRACMAKFSQHDELRDLLVGTDDAMLIENAPGDYYWGIGKDGSGKNRLGHILMLVRDELA